MQPVDREKSTVDTAAALLTSLQQAWETQDTALLRTIFAPEAKYEEVPTGRVYVGPEGIAEYMKVTLAGAPESTEMTPTNLIRQGNHVVAEWVWSGTHTGSWVGEAPTGKHFSVRGVSVFDVEDGRIQRVSDYMDFYTWLHQIGVLPSLEDLGRSLMGSAGKGG